MHFHTICAEHRWFVDSDYRQSSNSFHKRFFASKSLPYVSRVQKPMERLCHRRGQLHQQKKHTMFVGNDTVLDVPQMANWRIYLQGRQLHAGTCFFNFRQFLLEFKTNKKTIYSLKNYLTKRQNRDNWPDMLKTCLSICAEPPFPLIPKWARATSNCHSIGAWAWFELFMKTRWSFISFNNI